MKGIAHVLHVAFGQSPYLRLDLHHIKFPQFISALLDGDRPLVLGMPALMAHKPF